MKCNFTLQDYFLASNSSDSNFFTNFRFGDRMITQALTLLTPGSILVKKVLENCLACSFITLYCHICFKTDFPLKPRDFLYLLDRAKSIIYHFTRYCSKPLQFLFC